MNKRQAVPKREFTINDYKVLMLRILNAHTLKDGIMLQKLECEIINTYKETTMNYCQYRTLLNTCGILLDDWRRNDK